MLKVGFGYFCKDKSRVKDQFKLVMKRMDTEHPNFGASSQMDSMKWWVTVAQETLKGAFKLNNFRLTKGLFTRNPNLVPYGKIWCRTTTFLPYNKN
jgi:hypothetical protein